VQEPCAGAKKIVLRPAGRPKSATLDGAKAKATTFLKVTSKVTGNGGPPRVTNMRERPSLQAPRTYPTIASLCWGSEVAKTYYLFCGIFLHIRGRARGSAIATALLSPYAARAGTTSFPQPEARWKRILTSAWRALVHAVPLRASSTLFSVASQISQPKVRSTCSPVWSLKFVPVETSTRRISNHKSVAAGVLTSGK
jgi:hypothetical protein